MKKVKKVLSSAEKREIFEVVRGTIICLLVIGGVITLIVMMIMPLVEITYQTYEITGFYRYSEEDFCAYTVTEDGGTKVIVFPVDITVIYPAKDDHDVIEVGTTIVPMRGDAIRDVKVYISKTLDEVEYLK
jgi:hypothetical protein